MQYLLLLANAPDAWDRPSDVPDDVFDDWAAYTRALDAAGVLLDGAGLRGPDVATTVRVRGGERLLTDGPFAETKEHLHGFYLIEAPDLDGALAWAARAPLAVTGSVEVRPLLPGARTAEQLATEHLAAEA